MTTESRPTRKAALLAAAVALFAATASGAACRRPDSAQLMRSLDAVLADATPTGLNVAPVSGAGRGLRWALVSWKGPEDGAAFVLDCQGRAVASKRLGVIERVRPGPLIAGHPTLETLYRPPVGPDRRVQVVALLVYAEGRIDILWKHESLLVETAPLVTRDEASVWRWRYESDGRTIRVTGQRTTGEILDMTTGRAKGVKRRTRTERYCWIPGRRRIDRC